ncbi:MAG: restriction endonuclease subunit S [Ruminococcus sp.]|nr:restriction endonuclease subunit S [Ruminococcus sp.]
MTAQQLKNSILQMAVQGKLVPQDPNDEPASVLLERIKAEKQELIKAGKIKKDKKSSEIFRGASRNLPYAFCEQIGKEIRDISDEIPFEIPDSWEWVRLGIISTYNQTKQKINAKDADVSIWGLDLEDIEKGGRLLVKKTVGERKAVGDKTVFTKGDILYSKLRPYLLKILVAPDSGICTPEIVPFTVYGGISAEYIVNFLKSPYVDGLVNGETYGIKMPRAGTDTMISLLVPLPPLSEQHRIVAKIEEILPYIERYGKAEEHLTALNTTFPVALKKSILQEAVQGKLVPQNPDDEPASVLLERIKAEKHKLVKEGKIKKEKPLAPITEEEIPFDIPESWEWCRLKNIVSLLGDGIHGTPEYSETGKYFFINGNNLSEGNIIIKDDTKKVDESQYLKYRKELNANTVFVSINGTIGNIAFYNNEPVILGKSACYFNLIIKEFKAYMYWLLKTDYFLKYAITNATGSTIKNVSLKTMNDFLVPLPPLEEQKRIVAKIEELMPFIGNLTK